MAEDALRKFHAEVIKRSRKYGKDKNLQKIRRVFHEYLAKTRYAHNFFWLGRPIIQLPQDVQLMQEVIWKVKPDLIIETGIAWGGSLIFSASMLTLLEECGQIKNGRVVGIDIDIRPHNKKAVRNHPLGRKIVMLEGSSIDPKIIGKVAKLAKSKKRVVVFLDSNHTHEYVLAELKAYGPLVSVGSYCVVGDTAIEDVPGGTIVGRPWGKGNNPKTAVKKFLKENSNFAIDKLLETKVILTGSPGGYLKRIR